MALFTDSATAHAWKLSCSIRKPIPTLSTNSLTLKLPRSDCQFSLLAATHFFINWLQEFGVQLRQYVVTDKFEYSHYLFAG